MAWRVSPFFRPFQLLLLLLLLLGVSVVYDVVVVQVVAVLRGVARLQEHRQQVVPVVLGVLHGEAGGGVLHTDARQEVHEERSVEVFTELVHYKPENILYYKLEKKMFLMSKMKKSFQFVYFYCLVKNESFPQ